MVCRRSRMRLRRTSRLVRGCWGALFVVVAGAGEGEGSNGEGGGGGRVSAIASREKSSGLSPGEVMDR